MSPIPTAPSWDERLIVTLKYNDFRQLFINEGLASSRRGQISKIKEMQKAGGHAGRVGSSLNQSWEANKKKLFDDLKRVARFLAKSANWQSFYNGVPAIAHNDLQSDVAQGPIRFYMTMLQVAYSFMSGDQLDYARQPSFLKLLWNKSQFEDVMKWAM